MQINLEKLDIIDLISERHVMLRKIIEDRWNKLHDVKISHTEWHILARIYDGTKTIAVVSKNINVTRQATHKMIKTLASKGLVEIFDAEHNKKEKCVKLTPYGSNCYELNERLKVELEEQIAEQIGEQHLMALKTALLTEWHI